MKVDKLSISMDPQLGDDVRSAAERAGVSVSAWLAGAAAARLRRQALGDFLVGWQARHGTITPAELAKARAELGHARPGVAPGAAPGMATQAGTKRR